MHIPNLEAILLTKKDKDTLIKLINDVLDLVGGNYYDNYVKYAVKYTY